MHHKKGSLWRKWDLHFHTPSSFDYRNKGVTNQQIIDGLVDSGVKVVAITDHHLIDVDRVKELQELGKGKITVLPGIELRSELGGSKSIHYIGIFSERCDLDFVWNKLKNKLNLTETEIANKGGDEKIYVKFDQGSRAIRELSGLISIHGGRKSNSIEGISNGTLFQQEIKSDLLKDLVDILELGRPDDIDSYQEKVFPAIDKYLPIIIGTDNHNIANYSLRESCWFRADPCFYGLKQVLIEPQSRIYIGAKPEKRLEVKQSSTHYIRSISINKKPASSLKDSWFDGTSIDLNHDLVAIIGNKGTGKSALAEVVGLLGNSHNKSSFSFLSSKRFRNPQSDLAQHFGASITWENGDIHAVSLVDDTNEVLPERIKCLPQGLLEEICNEIATDTGSKFNRELRKVIFSHVPKADRLNKQSLDELINHLTNEIGDSIEILKSKLRERNKEIVAIEERLEPKNRERLNGLVEQKTRELEAHKSTKPQEVVKPPENNDETKQKLAHINELVNEKETLESKIAEVRQQENDKAISIQKGESILTDINNFKSRFEQLRDEIEPKLYEMDLDFEQIISFEANTEVISKEITSHREKRQEANRLTANDIPNNLIAQHTDITRQIENARADLNEPNKLFESYKNQLREWEDRKQEITGNEGFPQSLEYYKSQLKQLDGLPLELENLKSARIEVVKEIYARIQDLAEVYRRLYAPVQKFSENSSVATEVFDLQFDVSLVDHGMEDSFFDWIARNKVGSFYGDADGNKTLKKIIEKHNFNEWLGAETLLEDLLGHLTEDKRQENKPQVEIFNQLRRGKTLTDFYDFIFSLDYLRPHYVLKLDGKQLYQLSPGERGTLLLIFYLLVDTSKTPLIIDQPEENLDNHTVYRHLVKAIKEAKKRRQIIIVTHNPNLAVVCDAEQIIVCAMDKQVGNRIEYMAGAIECPKINSRIVDILEGSQPALANRWEKYAPFREN